MRRSSLVAAALVTAACELPGLELPVDNGHTCRKIGLTVRDDSLLPGWTVHALVVERDDGDTGWALATDPDGRLMLQPWPVGPGHDLSGAGEPDDFRLVPGALDGQAWLLLDRPDQAQVWRLDHASSGALLAGPPLPSFPAPGLWSRRLVFLASQPFLLSVPHLAEEGVLTLQVSPLDATLAPGLPTPIEFWRSPCLDSVGCPSPPPGEMNFEALHTTEAGSSGTSATLIASYTPQQAEIAIHYTVVASVLLFITGNGELPGGSRREHTHWSTDHDVRVAPGQIAADAGGLYVLTGIVPTADDANDQLLRASESPEGSDTDLINTVDKRRASQLLQVGDSVVLGQRSGNAWCIAPIDPGGPGDPPRVVTEILGCLPLDPGAELFAAGHGQFLVRSEAGARRVAVGCEPEKPESE